MIKYTDELKKLNLPIGTYAIFSSGPLAVRNLRENNDLDIIVTKLFFEDAVDRRRISNCRV